MIGELNEIYSTEVSKQIAHAHGLSSVVNSLRSTLISAGSLYLRYSGEPSGGATDLTSKYRKVTQTSEIARRLKSELEDLDFWDRWKIYKRLETTGHPITENLDAHTKKNPLMAGDILIDEIGLILSAVTAYENDFVKALPDKADKNPDVGLTFFVEVVGAFWESATGEVVVKHDHEKNEIPSALAFISHCAEPLVDIDQESMARIAQHILQ